jgi:hypothetical protein
MLLRHNQHQEKILALGGGFYMKESRPIAWGIFKTAIVRQAPNSLDPIPNRSMMLRFGKE